jgi:hypothetical protein
MFQKHHLPHQIIHCVLVVPCVWIAMNGFMALAAVDNLS